MSSIQSVAGASWQTAKEVSSSKAADDLHNQLAGTTGASGGENENKDGSKTVIERNVITAGDGSKIMVLTQVTINADGSRGKTKIISRMKVGGANEEAGAAGTKKKETTPLTPPGKQDAAEKSSVSAAASGVKNTAGKEYEQYSLTGSYDMGLLFKENI